MQKTDHITVICFGHYVVEKKNLSLPQKKNEYIH
jgi:hypothetical protein